MLEVKEVSNKKRQGILQQVTFSVEPGYIVGVVGKNGAGKSTMLQTIFGIRGYTGQILWGGKDIREDWVKWKQQVSYIGEEARFFEQKTILKNMEILSTLYETFDKEVFFQSLHEMKVGERKKVATLSRGERVRFEIAFARAHNTKIYLMDEVTAGMDPLFRQNFYQLLRRICTEDTLVFLSTHIASDIEKNMDYICELEQGKLLQFRENL